MPTNSRIHQYFTDVKNAILPDLPADVFDQANSPIGKQDAKRPVKIYADSFEHSDRQDEPTPQPPDFVQGPGSGDPPWDDVPGDSLDDDIMNTMHPVDKECFELTGKLPDLPLVFNPRLAEKMRKPPSSVHTLETSARFVTDCSYRATLLQPRIEHYKRAVELYAKIDGGYSGKNSIRLHDCRKKAWFVQNKHTGKIKVASSRCKLRWCPICRDVSRQVVSKAVEKWIEVQGYPKMITFTLKHSGDELSVQIKKLYDSFRKIRQRMYFKRHVLGGVWFFQIKQSTRTGEWHPHIHCLVAGRFLPHADLKKLWLKITGDSTIVDIRPVKDRDSAVSEVARYATSPADLTTIDFDAAYEVYEATKSKRICGSWGNAKGLVLRPQPAEDNGDWERVADFFYVNTKRQFDKTLEEFWKCYQQDRPWEGPEIQDPRDLFKEEMSFLLEQDPDPPDWRHLPFLKHEQKSNWASGFYDKEVF